MLIHHVEMCVKHGQKMLNYFTTNLGFHLKAIRSTNACEQFVVTNGCSSFLMTEPKQLGIDGTSGKSMHRRPVTHGTPYYKASATSPTSAGPDRPGDDTPDTVFNIALEVDDVERLTETMHFNGGHVHTPPTQIEDGMGKVTYSVVGTGFGNISHTLLDKRKYRGQFLPGFQVLAPHGQEAVSSTTPPPSTARLTAHMDHFTYACYNGQTDQLMEWYSKCFGMKRFYINSNDDHQEGLLIKENIGLSLKSAKCQLANKNRDFFLVFVEPTTTEGKNHVTKFLEEHKGPGIEHIAFHTDNMFETMRQLWARGTVFRQYPDSYYQMIAKKHPNAVYDNLQRLQEYSILIDVENHSDKESRYLLQAFTPNIFGQETFFLEIIQRLGAIGLGTGNITNIMKAIEMAQGNTQMKAFGE